MKKMSDVFDLPIDTGAAFAYGFNTIAEAHKIGRCQSAQHAAHAINHVDALADALSAIVMNAEDSAFELWLDSNLPSGDASAVQYKFEQSSEFKDFMQEFGYAAKALKAYRGVA